jgi:hypothetical protein
MPKHIEKSMAEYEAFKLHTIPLGIRCQGLVIANCGSGYQIPVYPEYRKISQYFIK